MKTVMCFGTFDILHLGHIHYFQQAKKHGDYLIVVIARDKTKQKQKKSTIFSERERVSLIKHLRLVDEVVLGYPDNHFRIIKEKKPDVICLGYDHLITERHLSQALAALDLHPVIKRLKPYKPKTQKSTKLKKIILRRR